MFVLGIETSCDETAASVIGPEGVCSDVVYTQEIHQKFGGDSAANSFHDGVISGIAITIDIADVTEYDGRFRIEAEGRHLFG